MARKTPKRSALAAKKTGAKNLKARSLKSSAAARVRGGDLSLASPDQPTPKWKLNTWRPPS